MIDTPWHIKDDVIEKYLAICKAAVEDDHIFDNFRNTEDYTAVCEHTSEEIGRNCYTEIVKSNRWLLLIDELYSDRVGNPKRIYKFGKYLCPASTMQYVWQISNIISKIGSLTDLTICEIGAGYGGLCRVIKQLFDVRSYDIIDLSDVLPLQEKYLNRFNIEADLFTSDSYRKDKQYDLVISNYALSEVREPMQSQYMNDIVLKARHGYITANREMDLSEVLNNWQKLSDIKGESPENFILQW